MKIKLSFLLLLLSPILATASNSKTQLVVWTKDGSSVTFALAEKPKVTFSETDLIITTREVEVNYLLENIERFAYEDENSTSITQLKKNDSVFKFDGEFCLLSSLKANSTISLYSLSGTLIFTKTIQMTSEYSFSLSELNTGVYIIVINGINHKITKK